MTDPAITAALEKLIADTPPPAASARWVARRRTAAAPPREAVA